MEIEKVKIVDNNRRGFKSINKIDFDETKHKLYVEGAVKAEPETKTKPKGRKKKVVADDNN